MLFLYHDRNIYILYLANLFEPARKPHANKFHSCITSIDDWFDHLLLFFFVAIARSCCWLQQTVLVSSFSHSFPVHFFPLLFCFVWSCCPSIFNIASNNTDIVASRIPMLWWRNFCALQSNCVRPCRILMDGNYNGSDSITLLALICQIDLKIMCQGC